jgi:hypothetical protein
VPFLYRSPPRPNVPRLVLDGVRPKLALDGTLCSERPKAFSDHVSGDWPDTSKRAERFLRELVVVQRTDRLGEKPVKSVPQVLERSGLEGPE